MYTLHGSPKNRSFRVLWMLEELGVNYKVDPLLPQSREALKLNPAGKLPAFSDGDTVIIDSSAICQYLADKHNQFTFKAGTAERGLQDSFLHFALDDLDGILWVNAKHSFVFPEERRVVGIKDACMYDFERSMKSLDARFGDGPFLMGEQFTVPDIILGHCAGWAKNAGFTWHEGRLSDYVKRLNDRPAWQRAHEIRTNS